MKKLRTFLAVEVSHEVRTHARAIIQQLAAAGGVVKWVEPENMHITLKFFGDTQEKEIYEITQAVQPGLEQQPPVEITVGGVGAFPRIERPRTIWAGVTEGNEAMVRLQERLEEGLRGLGYRRETRRYHPHLTLGRVRDRGALPELALRLRQLAHQELGQAMIDQIVLFSSELRSSGAEHTPMAAFPLKG